MPVLHGMIADPVSPHIPVLHGMTASSGVDPVSQHVPVLHGMTASSGVDPVSPHVPVLHGMTASCGHLVRWTRTLQPQGSTYISQLPSSMGLILTFG